MFGRTSNQKLENNPMQSSRQGPRGLLIFRKPFDVSGKSPAQ
jgi:hypothetical protein